LCTVSFRTVTGAIIDCTSMPPREPSIRQPNIAGASMLSLVTIHDLRFRSALDVPYTARGRLAVSSMNLATQMPHAEYLNSQLACQIKGISKNHRHRRGCFVLHMGCRTATLSEVPSHAWAWVCSMAVFCQLHRVMCQGATRTRLHLDCSSGNSVLQT
jgi:hypothetical protein